MFINKKNLFYKVLYLFLNRIHIFLKFLSEFLDFMQRDIFNNNSKSCLIKELKID